MIEDPQRTEFCAQTAIGKEAKQQHEPTHPSGELSSFPIARPSHSRLSAPGGDRLALLAKAPLPHGPGQHRLTPIPGTAGDSCGAGQGPEPAAAFFIELDVAHGGAGVGSPGPDAGGSGAGNSAGFPGDPGQLQTQTWATQQAKTNIQPQAHGAHCRSGLS